MANIDFLRWIKKYCKNCSNLSRKSSCRQSKVLWLTYLWGNANGIYRSIVISLCFWVTPGDIEFISLFHQVYLSELLISIPEQTVNKDKKTVPKNKRQWIGGNYFSWKSYKSRKCRELFFLKNLIYSIHFWV